MLLYLFPALTTLFPALSTFYQVNICPRTEAPKFPNNILRSLPFCLLILCFTVSLTPSINMRELSSDFMILIISSISSFQSTEVIPFPVLTKPFSCIFHWMTPFIAEADVTVANAVKTLLAKGTITFINRPVNFPCKAPRNPPD